MRDEQPLTLEQQETFNRYIRQRANGMPLSRIIGMREFWGMDFSLSADTLDPRADTETLIEAVFKTIPAPQKILDLGTGTGCILLSLLSADLHATGLGVDCSEGALKTAQHNCEALGFTSRATFQHGDWTHGIDWRTYDVIVSNPPYVEQEAPLERNVRDYDPARALFAGVDGLDAYREIASQLANPAYGQHLFLEIGQGQEPSVQVLFEQAGWQHLQNHTDLSGIVRCLAFKSKKDLQP